MSQPRYLDLPHVLMDFGSGLASVAKEVRAKFAGREADIPGLFAKMDPWPGAVAAYHAQAARQDVVLLAAPPPGNPSAWGDLLAWTERHLGGAARDRLLLTSRWDLLRHGILVTTPEAALHGFPGEITRVAATGLAEQAD